MPVTISRFVAVNSNKKENQHSLVTAGFIISGGLALLICFLVLILKEQFLILFNHSDSYLLILTMLPAVISTGVYTCFRGYLWGKEEFFKASIVELVEQILRIIFCILIIFSITKINKILPPGIAFGIAGVLSTILGLYYYFKIGGKLNKPVGFKKLIKTSLPITTVRVLASILTPIISIVIPFRLMAVGYTSSQALSQIGVMLGMTFPLLTIPSTIIGSLSTALIPDISSLEDKKDYAQLNAKVNNSINFSLVLTFLVIPPFMALGQILCLFLFGNAVAGEFLVMSAWIMIPMGLTQLTTTILNSMGHERKTFSIYLISGGLLLLCIWFLPQYVGIKAIIYGMGISNLINCILNIRQIKKYSNLNQNYIGRIFILSLLTILPILITKQLLSIINGLLPDVVIIIVLGLVCELMYCTLLVAFNISDIKVISKGFLKKIKTKFLKKKQI